MMCMFFYLKHQIQHLFLEQSISIIKERLRLELVVLCIASCWGSKRLFICILHRVGEEVKLPNILNFSILGKMVG